MTKNLKELYKFLSGHPDINLSTDEPMSKHTSFKVGGPATLFCELKTTNVIEKAIGKARELGIEPVILGNGSNLLVDDAGIPGAVYKIVNNNWYLNDNIIVADAGLTLAKVTTTARRTGLTGFEFAAGIPGTIGGAVYMNAGAYDGEMSKIVKNVKYLNRDGLMGTLSGEDLEFGYRESYFKNNPDCVILSATIELGYGDPDAIKEKMDEFSRRRREKQPVEYPSAGSVFKRPKGYFAGALIEQSGLKGYTVGGAQVSEKHAGFIVNRGGATCSDVRKIVDHIKETVLKDHGVELECEVLFAPNDK